MALPEIVLDEVRTLYSGEPDFRDALTRVSVIPLTDRQSVAVLARALYRIGYADHVSGHITFALGDDTLLATPRPYNWNEIGASDIVRIDLNGRVLEGKHDVSRGIPLHLALHRARHGVKVAVHNHTRYSQIWAAAHKLPPIYDQTSALTSAKTTVVNEFEGHVGDFATAESTVEKVGDADISLLGGHGVFVLADDVSHLFRRAYAFEWRCRLAWEVQMIGGGVPLPDEAAKKQGDWVEQHNFPGFWEGAVRQEIRQDPSVLE